MDGSPPTPPPPRGIMLDYYSSEHLRPPKPLRLIVLAIMGIIYGASLIVGGLGLLYMAVGLATDKSPGNFFTFLVPFILMAAMLPLRFGSWALIGSVLCLRQKATAFRVMVSFGWVLLVVSIVMIFFLFSQRTGCWEGVMIAADIATCFQIVILVVMYSPAVKRALPPVASPPQ